MQDDEFCVIFSPTLLFSLLCCFHSRFDGNAVTMLPPLLLSIRGRRFRPRSMIPRPIFFSSTVKIQCHVQSLFINRNEMLALRWWSVLRWSERREERKTKIIPSDERWWCHLPPSSASRRAGRMKDDIVIVKALVCSLKVILWFQCKKRV